MSLLNGPTKTLGTSGDGAQRNKQCANFKDNIRFQDLYGLGPFSPSTVQLWSQNSCCLLLWATGTSFSIHEPLQISWKNIGCFHIRQCLHWTQDQEQDDLFVLVWSHQWTMQQGPWNLSHCSRGTSTQQQLQLLTQWTSVLLWLSNILNALDLTSLKSQCSIQTSAVSYGKCVRKWKSLWTWMSLS